MKHDPILVPCAGTDGPTPRQALVRGQYLVCSGQNKRERGEVLAYLRYYRWQMHQARTLDEADRPPCPWQSN